MKVLITGINGFLGRELVDWLKYKEGIELFGMARTKAELPLKYIEADILDKNLVQNAFRKYHFDIVIHLAAITAHDQIVENQYETLNINVNGTKNLLQAFNKYCKNALFVYASTGKVYGDTNETPISEEALTKPMNILGKSKYITERIVDFYAEPNNKYLITKIFNIFGGKQKDNFIVPTIINQLKHGTILNLGNITDQRDYLYIKDFIDAFWKCIEHKDELKQVEIINIGSGIAASVHDIICAFEKYLGIKITVQTDKCKLRNDEKPLECCNNTKLKKLTGWYMRYSFEDALKEICEEQGIFQSLQSEEGEKTMDYRNNIQEYLNHEIQILSMLDIESVNNAMNLLMKTYEKEGTIYIFGNGGSSATASHFQNDFNKGVSECRSKKFHFHCLNDNVATIMAVANDIGFEEIFRFQIQDCLKASDIIVALSGSGNSENVIRAVKYAKECGNKIIGLTGYNGGKLKELSDISLHVPINNMQITEDIHMVFDHLMMSVFCQSWDRYELHDESFR